MNDLRFLFVFFSLSVGLPLAMAGPSCGQETEDNDPVIRAWRELDKMNECARCHYRGAQPNPLAPRAGEFARQSEARHWVRRDKHAIARRRIEPLMRQQMLKELGFLRDAGLNDDEARQWLGLSNQLSHGICEQLGYDVTKAEGYAQFRDNCLGCHGGYSNSSPEAHFSRSEPGLLHTDNQQPGISCNYCHQIGDNTVWISEHDSPKTWRLLPPEEKSKNGMRDLVSLDTQASLCCDCHVGNIAENKFVTHEMYAAGHPPLPSFELQTFCESMPQHWRTPSELYESLGNDQGDEYFKLNYPRLFGNRDRDSNPREEFWISRKVMTGALQARRRSLELLVQAADTNRWGDYALYDCAACHHELRVDSRRQRHGFPGVPGRPRQPIWPLTLADVVMKHGNAKGPLVNTQFELVAAMDKQPFGDPHRCASVAKEAIRELQDAQDALASSRINAARAREFFAELANVSPSQLIDYHSARQVMWAMRQVGGELETMNSPLPTSVQSLFAWSEGDVVDGISTQLPAGRKTFIVRTLEQELRLRGDYTLDELTNRLDRTQELLKAE